MFQSRSSELFMQHSSTILLITTRRQREKSKQQKEEPQLARSEATPIARDLNLHSSSASPSTPHR
jgi:hypothetical protein